MAPKGMIGEKAPSITLSQFKVLLEVVLQLRSYGAGSAIELILLIQKKNFCISFAPKKKN